MKPDIQIAQQATLKPISEIAASLGIADDHLECYGRYKAKLSPALWEERKNRPNGKLVLVTAINPTPAGEGKTTVTVGLGQAMHHIGKQAIVALREPSLGPVFGMKGGAAGGGYAQVLPMEDINLHFTGDMHAITAANNLLAAMLDNHLHQGNALRIDPRRILWKRCLDMNDRALRNITIGLGGVAHGIPREDGFQITVASEVMAILCLAENLTDLEHRFGEILVAYTDDDQPIFARDLNAQGAMAALMKEAIKPNFVQTLEHTPVLIHGGPFANIAHGCNSVSATRLALKLSDYTITEAGFGADLGAEKFFHIKCRAAGIAPDAVVIVATVRALKYAGNVPREDLAAENGKALAIGANNLAIHLENMKKFGVPVVVALNRFATDTDAELAFLHSFCEQHGVPLALTEVFAKGGAGGVDLAQKVVQACESPNDFRMLYSLEDSIEDKIETIATQIYRADGVRYTTAARKQLSQINSLAKTYPSLAHLPICMAKTQYSLSDDPTMRGVCSNFLITVHQVKLSAGAGFLVVYTGNIMTMPGLPKTPAAETIGINDAGEIEGLF